MKIIKVIFSAVIMLCLLSSFTPTKKALKTVYAFGVSASFTDSVVYFTEIQQLDSAVIDKNGFLVKRDAYSYQLKYHLEDKGALNRTCMTYFSDSKSELSKELSKLSARYQKNKECRCTIIDPKEFKFTKAQ